MDAAFARRGLSKARAELNDARVAHPMWRKIVAGGMAVVFALTLALFGLMLCVGPVLAP